MPVCLQLLERHHKSLVASVKQHKNKSFFFLSMGFNTEGKRPNISQQKLISWWWAASQRTHKGLRQACREKRRWPGKSPANSYTWFELIGVNKASHKSNARPASGPHGIMCSAFRVRRVRQEQKLWEHLFYSVYKSSSPRSGRSWMIWSQPPGVVGRRAA